MMKTVFSSLIMIFSVFASLFYATPTDKPVSAEYVAANFTAGAASLISSPHDVAITELTAPPFAKPGEIITYLIHCKSYGMDSEAKITDTLSANVVFVSTSCSLIDNGHNFKCIYNDSANTLTWDVVFDTGASFIIYLSVKVSVNAPANSLIINAAAIETNDLLDSDYNNNHKEVATRVMNIMNIQRCYLYQVLNNGGNTELVNPVTQTGNVAIEHGNTVTLLSDQAADTPVFFDTGAWTVRLNGNLFGICSVQIGESDGTPGGFSVFSGSQRTVIAFGEPLTIDIYLEPVQVTNNHYLALQITNYGTGSISTDGTSCLIVPNSIPVFSSTPVLPVPELSTMWLLGLGLACLGSYTAIIMKKRARVIIG